MLISDAKLYLNSYQIQRKINIISVILFTCFWPVDEATIKDSFFHLVFATFWLAACMLGGPAFYLTLR